MKTKWLHIIGGLIALSSISVGMLMRDPFMSLSIAVALMLLWDAKDSPNEDFLRKLNKAEMNGLQRGFKKGMRIKEMFIIALLIPALALIAIHPMSSIFLGTIIVGMIVSAIANEVELKKMERVEREMR